MKEFDPKKNYEKTKKLIDFKERKKTRPITYNNMGFMSGLEVHQQLKTEKKLFCRCPAGLYQSGDDYDAEIVRHMRPTLSELGEYDGTALMEFKTKKNIFYRIKYESACTYDIDDTPPFPINRQALDIAMEISLLVKLSIVGELHITRKQYLDGSIPTGFQRTGILGIDGEIQLKNKKVRIAQLSIEEDSCREVEDKGHNRIFTTDRLGMPLIETVTYPDMKTPDEVKEAAQYIRYLTRSTNKVRTGIGAAREDVNVSIKGGRRVEIKGVSKIKWIPDLTHNEAFRQKALLEIMKIINERVKNKKDWKISYRDITYDFNQKHIPVNNREKMNYRIVVINLPHFKGLLSFFTQPEKMFADEISDRLKVIACVEKPNMYHSEELNPVLSEKNREKLKEFAKSSDDDAWILIWVPEDDIKTAIETVEERCILAFEGVPNETRKALKGGITVFERVLPGPDRMYPDTDSAPLSIDDEMIERIKKWLPEDIHLIIKRLKKWKVPEDEFEYILSKNLYPIIKKIVNDFELSPVYVSSLFAHTLKSIEGREKPDAEFSYNRIYDLISFVIKKKLKLDIVKYMLPLVYQHPNMDFDSILLTIGFKRINEDNILSLISDLRSKFKEIKKSKDDMSEVRWIMGQLLPVAIGNVELKKLESILKAKIND